MPTSPGPIDWCAALEAEYLALFGEKPFLDDGPSDPDARLSALHHLLHERRPTALCLSGGGIRSATFGLGVLQALATVGVLGKLDYLSTVSGGGYVGGWLTTWLHRAGRDAVLTQIDHAPAEVREQAAAASPVDRVRATCRYLAPQGGLLSADVWTLAATMGRNLLLNWLVLLPLLAAALLVPRLYLAAIARVEQNVLNPSGVPCLAADTAPFWLALLSLSMFVVAIGYVAMNFTGRGEEWSQNRFLSFVVAPTVIGTIALTLFWSAYPCEPNEVTAVLVSAVVPAACWLVIGRLGRNFDRSVPLTRDRAVRMRVGARTVVAALVAGPIVGFGTYWFAHKYFYFNEPLGPSYAVFGVPGILGLILLANTTFLGLASGELTDAALEWWNRFAAWLAIAAAVWLAAGVLVFYIADLIELGVRTAGSALNLEHHTSSTIFSVLVPLLSSLVGIAARRTGASGPPSALRLALQRLTLPLVIVLLLATIAWFNAWALRGFNPPDVASPAADLDDVVKFGGFILLLGLLVSRFVPVNRFSLHGMYRQRLVRTFLGASHLERDPNAFTGFDPTDDVRVHELSDVRPLHVINATLNNVSSTQYGRNERKAFPFTFSPLHVGTGILGYRRSCEYGSDGGGPATGLSLGMALAVSGAAASPAMGMYSSKARAFLLTLANARLGLWFGNPDDEKTWQRSDPALGVGPFARELLGLETDTNPYIYLSDGGHFENLGLWSMVARRCGIIIVSDAGCDPDYAFDDLANAVRRIRIDLGIPIEIDTSHISRAGQGVSNAHVAIGTVIYSAVDRGAPNGVLIYVKATLSGDEPVDVRNFASLDPTFPHDSTGNQFFDEARFESYRALGYHSIMSVANVFDSAEFGGRGAALSGYEAAFAPPGAARV